MPELPEIETIRRGLLPFVTQQTIRQVTLHRHDLRYPFPADFATKLQNSALNDIERKGKFLLFHLDQHHIWIVHLGMSGCLRWYDSNQALPKTKHDHVVVDFNHGSLVYNDARRFGWMDYVTNDQLNQYKPFRSMGPDPLSSEFHTDYLKQVLNQRSTAIKLAIMDQSIVAGIGNIYASESLYWAKIHPERPCRTLHSREYIDLIRAIQKVLTQAIAQGGSSLRDYRKTDGELGYFQNHWAVYNRAGLICPQYCKAAAPQHQVIKITQAGRSSFYCAICQK